jgi:hypothetical protein
MYRVKHGNVLIIACGFLWDKIGGDMLSKAKDMLKTLHTVSSWPMAHTKPHCFLREISVAGCCFSERQLVITFQ